jgi:hypothetical protein
VSLEELSRGEAELLDCSKQPSLVQRLSQAVAHYSKSVAALKVKWCIGFVSLKKEKQLSEDITGWIL